MSSEELDSSKIQAFVLKDSKELTDVEKQSLTYIYNVLGEDKYSRLKEAIITTINNESSSDQRINKGEYGDGFWGKVD